MLLRTRLSGKIYAFASINEVLAKANEEKAGDAIMGIAAQNASERVAARIVLADLTVADLRNNPVVPWEEDEISRLGDALVNENVYQGIQSWSMGELRDWLLAHETNGADMLRISQGLTAECVAGVTKLMTAMDLVYAAKKIRNPSTCVTTIGLPGTLSSRLQPNHPTDSVEGILASAMEGLSFGQGDALIGINPVDDGVENTRRVLDAVWEFMQKWQIPTQNCILSHITTQMSAVKKGAQACVMFQSLAGTELANKAFGIHVAMIREGYDVMQELGTGKGPHRMYFETGQGSEMSINSACGADMLTLEARCHSFAKAFTPFMVNTVTGFIGSETLYDGKQVIRASLEDHFMGKFVGLPMGMDPCYTNHTPIDQNDQEITSMLLTMGGVHFLMSVPMGDDVMLAYQNTSHHDIASLREMAGLLPTPEFHRWLMRHGIMDEAGKLTAIAGDLSIFSSNV